MPEQLIEYLPREYEQYRTATGYAGRVVDALFGTDEAEMPGYQRLGKQISKGIKAAKNLASKRVEDKGVINKDMSLVKMNAYNNAYTAPVKKVKRRKQKKVTGPKLSKRQRLGVKALIHKKEWALSKTLAQNFYNDIGCAYNKVARHAMFTSETPTAAIASLGYTIRDGAGSGVSARTISASADNGEKFRYEDQFKIQFNNNSNMHGELMVFVFKCLEYTDTSAVVELQDMRDAAYKGASVSITDDHLLINSVPGQKRTKWKMAEKWTINMKGGEQSTIWSKKYATTYDVDRISEEGTPDFVPGSIHIEVRMVGRASHYNVVTTAASTGDVAHYANQGTQALRVDYVRTRYRREYVYGQPDVVAVNQPNNYLGFYTALNATEKVVSADPEQPEVAVPAQA